MEISEMTKKHRDMLKKSLLDVMFPVIDRDDSETIALSVCKNCGFAILIETVKITLRNTGNIDIDCKNCKKRIFNGNLKEAIKQEEEEFVINNVENMFG